MMSTFSKKLILDIGMFKGGDSAFYLKKGFRVIAVEANPAVAESARTRLRSDIAEGRLTIHNVAVSENSGDLTFYVCENEGSLSTADPGLKAIWERRGAKFRAIPVKGCDLGKLLAGQPRPRFAKIDIEGFDLIALEQLSRAGITPTYLSIELVVRYGTSALDLLTKMGYRRFQLIPQSKVPMQVEPDPPHEGRHSGVTFGKGSSGLFGKDLGGKWLSYRAMRRDLMSLRAECSASARISRALQPVLGEDAVSRMTMRMFPRSKDWYDLHAAFKDAEV